MSTQDSILTRGPIVRYRTDFLGIDKCSFRKKILEKSRYGYGTDSAILWDGKLGSENGINSRAGGGGFLAV